MVSCSETSWLPRLRPTPARLIQQETPSAGLSHVSLRLQELRGKQKQRPKAGAGLSGLLGPSRCPASSTQKLRLHTPDLATVLAALAPRGQDEINRGANRTNRAALVKCVCLEWHKLSECSCGPVGMFSQPGIKSEGANPSTWVQFLAGGGGGAGHGGAAFSQMLPLIPSSSTAALFTRRQTIF